MKNHPTITIKDVKFVLIEKEDYVDMVNRLEKLPPSPYTFMTKTSANKLVRRLLRSNKEICWNDNPDEEYDDGCCSQCCVYKILGYDAADRICQRGKRWSK